MLKSWKNKQRIKILKKPWWDLPVSRANQQQRRKIRKNVLHRSPHYKKKKKNFPIRDFYSECDQIRTIMRI